MPNDDGLSAEAREPERDLPLGEAIKRVEAGELSDIRVEALRTRIAAATRVALRERRDRRWWEWTASWARAEIAIAAAAGIVAIALVEAAVSRERAGSSSPTAVTSAASGVSAVTAHLDSMMVGAASPATASRQALEQLVTTPTDAWLFAAAVTP